MATRIGIDTGGTFTDLVAFDERTGLMANAKVPSTPDDYLKALRAVLLEAQIDPDADTSVVLGITIAINTVLERKGARVGLIATKGFEDVLLIQRADRKSNYDLHWRKPRPIVKRRCCIGVEERVNYKGEILAPLSDGEMDRIHRELIRLIEQERIEAAAICFLFSFKNSEHEQKLKSYLQSRLPGFPISVSSEVAPIWREYERANTTAVDAYVRPVIARYVEKAALALDEKKIGKSRWLVKSNGGMASLRQAAKKPVEILISGLVGGIVAGRYWGNILQERNIITFDMGGTSCDIGIIHDGQTVYTTELEVEWGLPVATPAAYVSTLGAGGGSIAWIDKGGFLKVGPHSAGADPGPVCYGKGGTETTVTDANLILERLNSDYFLGGRLALDKGLAGLRIGSLAGRLSMDADQTASSIIQIVNNNMAEAIKLVTVSKGIDPKEYTLIAFGGAGPLHACELAKEVMIPKVVVPIYPGQFSALGTILSDIRVDKVVTLDEQSESINLLKANRQMLQIEKQIREELIQEGYHGKIELLRFLSLRYAEQNYEQDIPIAAGGLTERRLEDVYARFHQRHKAYYGYAMPEKPLEIVHFKAIAIGVLEKPVFPPIPQKTEPSRVHRQVFFPNSSWSPCSILRREALGQGFSAGGPLIVEEPASTTLVPPDFRLTVDGLGNLILEDTGER